MQKRTVASYIALYPESEMSFVDYASCSIIKLFLVTGVHTQLGINKFC